MRETQILRGLGKARETAKQKAGFAPRQGVSPLHSLRRGAASLQGPGTATSDSIPAHLSKGEAVLPAATVKALGSQNIAQTIQQTTGKTPAVGLRTGGHFAGGEIPGGPLPTIDESAIPKQAAPVQPSPYLDEGLRVPGSANAAPASNGAPTYNVPPENAAFKQQAQAQAQARMSQPQANPSVSQTPSAGPSTPQPPVAEPAPVRPGWRGAMDRGVQGVKNVVKAAPEVANSATNSLKSRAMGFAGGAANVANGAVQIGSAARDILTPGMTDDQKMGRVAEGVGRMGGMAVGGTVGADLGSLTAPFTGPVGPIVGGLIGGGLGYFAPEAANKVGNAVEGKLGEWTNGAIGRKPGEAPTPLPSDVAAGLRATQNGNQPSANTPTPVTPEVTPYDAAGVAQRTGAMLTPQQGAGRGRINPANVDGTRTDSGTDLTQSLANVPANLPSNMRSGAIYKTKDTAGNTTYSGSGNVGANAPMLDGKGDAITPRGSMRVINGAPTFGPNGSYVSDPDGTKEQKQAGIRAALTGPNGKQLTPQDVAIMQANQRDGVDQYRGTSADQSLQSGGQGGAPGGLRALLMQRIANNMKNFGVMGNHSMQMLQAMDNTDIDRQRMQNEDSYHRGDLGLRADNNNMEHQDRQATNNLGYGKLAVEQQRYGAELGQKGSEMLQKLMDQSYNGSAVDAKDPKVEDQDTRAGFRNFVNNSAAQVNGRPMNYAAALDDQGARQAMSRLDGEYSLQRMIAEKGGNMLYNNTPKAGALRLKGIDPAEWNNYLNGATTAQLLRDKLINSKQFKFEGLGGRTAQASDYDIRNHKNAQNMYAAIDAMLEQQKAEELNKKK